MRFLILLFIIISVAGLAGHAPQQATGDNSNSHESIFQFYQFPSHPNLTHLCRERVQGSSGEEITWDAFASLARPAQLVAYYRRKLGDAGFTSEGGGGRWGLPADAPRPERVLEVSAVGAANPSRHCEKRPPANSRAIILLSRMESR
ncbi:MAG: hypothetical protein AAFX95_23295 [Cyanobacteria bacterium J06639_16]